MKTSMTLATIGLAVLSTCCNKTEAQRDQEEALENANDRQEQALARKDDQKEKALEEKNDREEKALERAHEEEQDQRAVEQRGQALLPGAASNAAQPNAAARGMTAKAVDDIATARCAREARCGNIGPDKDYSSSTQCQNKISQDWKDELNAYDCPRGVVAKQFSECLQAIREEECNAPFDKLARIATCRQSGICAD